MSMLETLIRKVRLILFILLCIWVPAAGFLETFRGIHAEIASFNETVGGGE